MTGLELYGWQLSAVVAGSAALSLGTTLTVLGLARVQKWVRRG
jgi:hypothetical protein